MDEFVGSTGRLDLTIPACVARGVALLDHIYPVGMDAAYPTWDSRVNLDRLDTRYPDQCVFGQVMRTVGPVMYRTTLLGLFGQVVTDPVIIEAANRLPLLHVDVVFNEVAMWVKRSMCIGIVYGFDRDVPSDSDAFGTLTQLWTGVITDRRK